MAEYIDIDKIEYRKGVLLDSEENPLPIIHKVATIEVIRDWTPKADVVERSEMDKEIAIAYRLGQEEERSKIDKVIKEIRKLLPKPTAEDILDGNPKKEAIWEILMEVEKILKRNLGDEE